MKFTLDSFAAECYRILKSDPSRTGRLKICALLQDVLKDQAFIKTYLHEATPDRQLLYEDDELGFCILAHMNREAREANPHDHGPAWAIYGQAIGETEMSDWEVIEPASGGNPAKVRRVRTYTLKPGMAHLYNEGEVHSPKRSALTGLIRIEGKNMETVSRVPYDAVSA